MLSSNCRWRRARPGAPLGQSSDRWRSGPQKMRLGEAGPDALPLVVYALEHLGNESIVIADAPDKTKIRAVVPAGFEARIGEVLHGRFRHRAGALLRP